MRGAASQLWTLGCGLFGINTYMTQYYIAKARSSTGQTVKNQDLSGARFSLAQRALAEDSAAQLAVKMTARTGQQWRGFVELYTPTAPR